MIGKEKQRMKRSAILLDILTLLHVGGYAQSSVKGKVVDPEGKPLEMAAVLLVDPQDSTIAAHTVANNEGLFALEGSRKGQYWLQVHIMGYKTQSRTVQLPTQENQLFNMAEDPTEIEAVRVMARRKGMNVQGDTVKYNIRAYTTGAERTLGDLLNQLPGIKVSPNGTVTAQGKQVKKILFNGRDLFGNNVMLATQNINADMADSVQVVHGYSEYDVLQGFKSKNETVIDVHVKDGVWNKISGDLELLGGYKWLLSTRNKLIYLGKNSMLSAMLNGGNTAESSLNYYDYIAYQGGFASNTGGFSMSMLSNEGMMQIMGGRMDTYEKMDAVGALNYSYHEEKKLQVIAAAMLMYGQADAENFSERTWLAGLEKGRSVREEELHHMDTRGVHSTLRANYFVSDDLSFFYSMMGYLAEDKSHGSRDYLYQNNLFHNREQQEDVSCAVRQILGAKWKLGEHGMSLSLNHHYEDESPERQVRTDRLILPLAIAPSSGIVPFDYNVVERTHRGSIQFNSYLSLTEEQFIELSAEGNYDHLDYRNAFLSNGGAVRTLPAFGATLGNKAILQHNTETLSLMWKKNKGFAQWVVGVEGVHWGRHICDATQNDRYSYSQFYALPTASLDLNLNAMHSLELDVRCWAHTQNGESLP